MKTKVVASTLLALLIISCDSSNNPTDVRLGEEFQLGYGQSAALTQAGLTITFKALGEDSRCPEGEVCVWSGNARVVISIAGTDASLNMPLAPREVLHSGHKIQLLAVRPYPKVNEQHKPENYSISLIVTKE